MGHLTIEFSKFVIANTTSIDKNLTKSIRQLQSDEANLGGLLLQLSIDQAKNGLDEDFIQFNYQVTEFNDQKVEIQIDFNCTECISSFETDIMTIIGRTKNKVLFTYDVSLPPQVDRDG